jgi:hypothetical protein
LTFVIRAVIIYSLFPTSTDFDEHMHPWLSIVLKLLLKRVNSIFYSKIYFVEKTAGKNFH